MSLIPTPTHGYCNCGRPSASAASGWCGYCQWRDITVAAKSPAERPHKTLRDEYALAWLPHAINDAIKGYGHVCPTVIERAQNIAYNAADAMMKARDQ